MMSVNPRNTHSIEESRIVASRVDFAFFVLFIALLTAVLETLLLFGPRLSAGRIIWASRDHLWMASVGYLALFVIVGAIAWLISKVVPARVARLFPYVFVASTAAFCLTLPYRQLSHFATAILSLGIGVQVARTIVTHHSGAQRLFKRGGLVLAVLVIAFSTVYGLARLTGERLALRKAGRTSGPSIVFIILDTVRASSLTLYGSRVPTTPRLQRWAERGVVFERAYSTAPWTLPSHASMFTGLWADDMNVSLRLPFREPAKTLAEVFSGNGYATAGFVANHDYTSYDSGLDRGFIHYEDYRHSAREIIRTTAPAQTDMFGQLLRARSLRAVLTAVREHNLDIQPTRWSHHKPAAEVNREFVRWLDRIGERRFFAFLNYYDAHEVYRCPPPFRERFRCRDSKWNAYHGAIAYLDHELDKLFNELERRGALDSTIIVITSDHGEQFGEHGLWGHGNSLYADLLHVPLVIFGPGIPARTRVDVPVSLRELPATAAAWAGIGPTTHRFPGSDLAGTWQRDTKAASTVDPGATLEVKAASGFGTATYDRSMVVDSLQYIRRLKGQEELYSFTDAAQTRNLAGDPRYAEMLRAFRDVMRNDLRKSTAAAAN